MRLFTHTFWSLALGAAVVSMAAATPSQAQHITTDYDRAAHFEQFHTFSFGNIHMPDPLLEQRIKDEVSKDLAAHGWRMMPEGGSVTIVAIGGVKEQQEYTTFYNGLAGWSWRRGWGSGGFGNAYTTVNQIPVGTLVIDMYETGQRQLLFRATATDQLSNNSDKITGKLDKAIDKIFNKFPPTDAM